MPRVNVATAKRGLSMALERSLGFENIYRLEVAEVLPLMPLEQWRYLTPLIRAT